MVLIFRVLAAYLICTSSSLFALGTQFLLIPIDATNLAMGSHVSSGGSPSVNPSLLQSPKFVPSLFFNSGQWYGDIKTFGVSYNRRLKKINNEIFLRQVEITDLEYREDRPSDDPNSFFASYGFNIGSRLSLSTSFGHIGMTIKSIYFSIYDQSSSGVLFDFGYSRYFQNDWSLGLSILNIGAISKFYNENPKLPSMALIGISKEASIKTIENHFYFTADYSWLHSQSAVRIGNKIKWKQLMLMAGAEKTKHTSCLSFGVGFVYGRFGFTYGMRFGSQDIGVPKILSVNFLLP